MPKAKSPTRKSSSSQKKKSAVESVQFVSFKAPKGVRKQKASDEKKRRKPKFKRASSAWIFYVKEHATKDSAFRRKHPNLEQKEVTALLSKEWHRLSDAEKAPYVKLAAKDKERSARERAAYKAEHAKPPNNYMKFANAHREQVRAENPDMSMTEVSKELGKMWKALSDGQKASWKKK